MVFAIFGVTLGAVTWHCRDRPRVRRDGQYPAAGSLILDDD
jgi:hypothetical protein